MSSSSIIRLVSTDRTLVEVQRGWLSSTEADLLFQFVCSPAIPWEMRKVRVQFAGYMDQPRLTHLTSDPLVPGYHYSGQFTPSVPWDPRILEICTRINATLGTHFNSCLMNRYRSGSDHVSYHSDAEGQLGDGNYTITTGTGTTVTYTGKMVATISLGATRRFALRRKGETKQYVKTELQHGDLCIMAGDCQAEFEHAILKQANAGERVSLTYREFRLPTATQ
jgi:alkylated DNA repair dioxygenase AlkB